MNWRSVEYYDRSEHPDVFFRVNYSAPRQNVFYVTGYITPNGEVYFYGSEDFGEGGYQCNIADLQSCGIESLHFVDPREIKWECGLMVAKRESNF